MRIAASLGVALLFVVVAWGAVWVRSRFKQKSPKTWQLHLAGVTCLLIFVAVNVSDWPGTILAEFWAEHAIFAATASTVPLIGAGFFIFEAREADETRTQERIDSTVAATARAGMVDHLVDLDVMLSLLGWEEHRLLQRWPDATDPESKPLRWLRRGREDLCRTEQGGTGDHDPRRVPAVGGRAAEPWHRHLVDQGVRRLMSGIKEWGPVISLSRDGRSDLVELGRLHRRLMELDALMRETGQVPAAVADLQPTCRRLAHSFEDRSGARPHRPEVLPVEGSP